MLIDRIARRLHDEHVAATDVLVNLERDFRVGEPSQPTLPDWNTQKPGNFPSELRMRATGKQLHLAKAQRDRGFHQRLFPPRVDHGRQTAGSDAMELNLVSSLPPTASTNFWLGRKDSNLRIRDPKSRALPLGHAPTLGSGLYSLGFG